MIIFLRWGKGQSAAILLVNNWSLAVNSGVSCMFEKIQRQSQEQGKALANSGSATVFVSAGIFNITTAFI